MTFLGQLIVFSPRGCTFFQHRTIGLQLFYVLYHRQDDYHELHAISHLSGFSETQEPPHIRK